MDASHTSYVNLTYLNQHFPLLKYDELSFLLNQVNWHPDLYGLNKYVSSIPQLTESSHTLNLHFINDHNHLKYVVLMTMDDYTSEASLHYDWFP